MHYPVYSSICKNINLSQGFVITIYILVSSSHQAVQVKVVTNDFKQYLYEVEYFDAMTKVFFLCKNT